MRLTTLTTATLAAVVGCAGLAAVTTLPASASTTAASTTAASSMAADFSGYQIVKLPNANVPNFTRRVVRCPAGKRAIGGGAEAQGNRAILVGSFPTEDGSGWYGIGRQDGYNDVGISVYAICANVG
ncbi:hypothetical protein ACFY19_35675 [Streptosporangium saharense]|uniref:hypothetical protein n=1 Tax=Streptosporangium saharense TaxID=1706840 RepID=UPI0036C20E68